MANQGNTWCWKQVVYWLCKGILQKVGKMKNKIARISPQSSFNYWGHVHVKHNYSKFSSPPCQLLPAVATTNSYYLFKVRPEVVVSVRFCIFACVQMKMHCRPVKSILPYSVGSHIRSHQALNFTEPNLAGWFPMTLSPPCFSFIPKFLLFAWL